MTENNNLSGNYNDQAAIIPTIYEKSANGTRAHDPFSYLLDQGIIFVAGPVTMESSLSVVAQLLALDAQNKKEVDMYIMSPGGVIDGGSAILDTMDYLKDKGIKIRTTAIGLAMSMGSAILVNGSPGERRCLPSTRIMLHEPAGGAQGKVADMLNSIAESEHMKRRMAVLYKQTCNMTDEQVSKVLNGPDAYMYGEEAKALGIIDKVAYPEEEHMLAIAKAQEDLARIHMAEKAARKERESNLLPQSSGSVYKAPQV